MTRRLKWIGLQWIGVQWIVPTLWAGLLLPWPASAQAHAHPVEFTP